ncbi:MAG: recombination protein RecR [Alphaproteobacteria bacterium]|nr:recombination protein RecR [Alphaproteobacteria bacterium]
MIGSEINELIQYLAKIPGLGPRSGRRAALHLIKHKDRLLKPLADAMLKVDESIRSCVQCGNLDTQDPCLVCQDPRRDNTIICVVEQVADLWALERTGCFHGRYHILGGTLSAIDGIGPEDLKIQGLIERVHRIQVQEIILALNATVEGQTTAHYIMERLKLAEVKITALAHGVPVGGELDYLDDGTLSTALASRRSFSETS